MRLKEFREKRQLTTRDVAEAVGTAPENIERWEAGEEEPSDVMVQKLADYFQCNVNSLLRVSYADAPATTPKSESPAPTVAPVVSAETTYKPIVCPRCGSKSLAFITESHKCLGARIFQLILLVIFALITMPALKHVSVFVLWIALLIIMVCLQISIWREESKTHAQCICKDCGKTWLHM